ncbi:XdhC family protein [Hymenobacter sp. BT175]|uniref:XdhC family protein n=1 Tax=Hymenobacter translucens TaxID=2886507 RepID=UPI001D0F0CA7|nr:XdhC/CoxI family protein [Hymenobacter translucens]MCC2545332.1 XdhC family protein [Hymenobacter translucens]
MTENQRLLEAYDGHRTAGRPCALATVVHVEGSAYRRAGARMLVTEDGQLTGAISGGCLEGDARRRARQALLRRQPVVVVYDTSDEDDLRHGMGQGCQGIIHILLEPLDFEAADNPLELLRLATRQTRPAVLATVFGRTAGQAAQLGERLLLTADGSWHGPEDRQARLAGMLLPDAEAALLAGQSATVEYESQTGPLQVSLEVIRPAVRLTVYGAGNDVQPLVRFAAALGWRVQVLDGRPAQATDARFPEAAAVRVVPLAEVGVLPPDDSLAVLMTHNYYYDLAVLRQLLAAPTPYIGLLGPRKKADQLLAELSAEGLDAEAALRNRLHSPVGLNLGAETPEEIALSIVAEIQAVLACRAAGFLRNTDGPIHGPAARTLTAELATPATAECPVS